MYVIYFVKIHDQKPVTVDHFKFGGDRFKSIDHSKHIQNISRMAVYNVRGEPM